MWIRNSGDAPSYSTVVELYDGPYSEESPLKDYRLVDYASLILQPGRKRSCPSGSGVQREPDVVDLSESAMTRYLILEGSKWTVKLPSKR